jgi:hypothetical protein
MERQAVLGLPATLLSAAVQPSWRLGAGELRRPTARRAASVGGGSSRADTLPELDHHAEAGAPEGALYVDGVLFGFSGAR